jgi:hypothetical protein
MKLFKITSTNSRLMKSESDNFSQSHPVPKLEFNILFHQKSNLKLLFWPNKTRGLLQELRNCKTQQQGFKQKFKLKQNI